MSESPIPCGCWPERESRMRKTYYPTLALDNIRKNARTYTPYLLTCIVTVAMHYIIVSLSKNSGLESMPGGAFLKGMMDLGGWVTAIFSVIILFYTSSFLLKNRKKEFGLFNILGMEKRHLARVMALETLYTGLLSLTAGLALGMVFDKLMFLLIGRLMDARVPLGFSISLPSVLRTAALFGGIFLLIFLYSARQIHVSKPIELLQGTDVGEREPKTKALLALLGLLFLGGGYGISLRVEEPQTAIVFFFLAVLLVIFGTYLLFAAGSIACLKAMRRNKGYYYQPRHFISVSGMIYRMKRNAVGLASICILSTMVLVTVSATASLMIGVEDIINTRYPYDIGLSARSGNPEKDRQAVQALRDVLEFRDAAIREETQYSTLEFSAYRQGKGFFPITEKGWGSDVNILTFMTLEDYQRLTGEDVQLAPGEVLLRTDKGSYEYDSLEVFGRSYRVAGRAKSGGVSGQWLFYAYPAHQIIVRDTRELETLAELQKKAYGRAASSLQRYYGANLAIDEKAQRAVYEDISVSLKNLNFVGEVESRAAQRPEVRALYAGFFFLGIFLGTLFLSAAILIIYYKQVSEGYEDRKRFEIMQKVGLSREEVRGSIRSQVLTVFFLPLAVAGLHTAVAFPIVRKLLLAFSLTNTGLYVLCTALSFLLFGALYCLVYLRTAGTYYKIVSR